MQCLKESGPLYFTLMLLVLIWEAWLGGTKKIKENSTLALVVVVIVSVIKQLFHKENNDGNERP